MDLDTMKRLKAKSKSVAQMKPAVLPDSWASVPAEITDEWIRGQLAVSPNELEAFERGLVCDFAEANISDLLNDIYQKTLESIITPLGLGKIISAYDRLGGNVDTIHNARQMIGSKKFKEAYAARPEYDKARKAEYHTHKDYIDANKTISRQKKEGKQPDEYTGQTLSQNPSIKVNQDHVISTEEINRDAAVVLAGLDGIELANAESNRAPTHESINKSKKAKTMAEFVAYLEKGREERQKQIAEYKQKSELTDKERKELRKLEALESADAELMMQKDEAARKDYNSKINKAYYGGLKFYKDLGISSGLEGVKMGFQQAFGLLCVDLTNALLDEIIDIYRHGFVAGVQGESLMDSLKFRLRRVAVIVWADWKKLVAAFKDGAISGIISNVITTLINIFFTTAKNIVRIIREGVFVLYRAAKTILFAPKDMDLTEAWEAALKIIVAGVGTLGGIALDETLGKIFVSVPLLAPISSVLSSIIAGIATGTATSLALFALDAWDPFGARDLKKRRHIREKLDSIEKRLLHNREQLLQEFGLAEPSPA